MYLSILRTGYGILWVLLIMKFCELSLGMASYSREVLWEFMLALHSASKGCNAGEF